MVEVDGLVAAELDGAGPLSHAVVSEQLHCTGEDLSRGLVVMEQIPTQQNKVHLHVETHTLYVHVALFVCLTLLASFFLPSHLSLTTCTCTLPR